MGHKQRQCQEAAGHVAPVCDDMKRLDSVSVPGTQTSSTHRGVTADVWTTRSHLREARHPAPMLPCHPQSATLRTWLWLWWYQNFTFHPLSPRGLRLPNYSGAEWNERQILSKATRLSGGEEEERLAQKWRRRKRKEAVERRAGGMKERLEEEEHPSPRFWASEHGREKSVGSVSAGELIYSQTTAEL
ncbi:unnamed protein product [Pleuronectes platessa]|uniref:Uncharacterized protein n=1 Tax=Pleuronectes platessa TaxID=8262 RepID=A0A9N7Z2U7_PLEPL|nr:unnamed protein product [Pleuronectes platessa]